MKKSFLFNCSSVGTAWDLIHDSRRKRMQTTISMAATTVPRVAYPYKTRDGGATVTILCLTIAIIIVLFVSTRLNMKTWPAFRKKLFAGVFAWWTALRLLVILFLQEENLLLIWNHCSACWTAFPWHIRSISTRHFRFWDADGRRYRRFYTAESA